MSLLSWIKNYLSGRTQVIRVDGKLSVSKDLTSSIVQGSGTRPLMFVTYINELAEIFLDYNMGVKLFADNLKYIRHFIFQHRGGEPPVCFITCVQVSYYVAVVCFDY